VGDQKVRQEGASPYEVTLEEAAARLVSSAERAAIFRSFLAYRRALRAEGLVAGFQWLGGSFASLSSPVPADLDLVTFYEPPPAWRRDKELERETVRRLPQLFHHTGAKAAFRCDAFFVNLRCDPRKLVRWSVKWYVLYAFSRELDWRGFVSVPLDAEDEDRAAAQRLESFAPGGDEGAPSS
jgi:hypothetical protein